MDTSKIGTARQEDDNRLAVLNARGLADRWRELRATFMRADLHSTGYEATQVAGYRSLRDVPDSPEGKSWIA